MAPPVTGVIWVGPIYDRGGYGSVSRNCLRGLHILGYPVQAIPHWGRHTDIGIDDRELMRLLEDGDAGWCPALVIHGTPDDFRKVKSSGVAKRIGCTIFETDRIPKRWVPLCNEMDEIWVPSEFNRRTFAASGVDLSKIFVLPYGIDASPALTDTDSEPRASGEAKRLFTFLYVFEFNWRKGIDLLLEAFLGEFRPGEAQLNLKAYFQWSPPPTAGQAEQLIFGLASSRFRDKSAPVPYVKIISGPISQEEMVDLYRACDLYISTDRANGWGMPCMEAMARAKPAATIDWSGSTEFMTADNSLLIRPTGRLQRVDDRLRRSKPDLYSGHRWAEVTVPEVRRVMRWAYEHPHELAQIGERAQQSILLQFSLEAAAARVVERLSANVPLPRQRTLPDSRLRVEVDRSPPSRLSDAYAKMRLRALRRWPGYEA